MLENEEEKLEVFHSIFASTRECIALLDSHYRYMLVNDAWLRLSGATREEVIGCTIEEQLGAGVFAASLKDKLDLCLQGEITYHQYWFTCASAGRCFMDYVYTPYRDRRNNIVGIIVNGRDITELAEPLEALSADEKRLQYLYKTGDVGLWDWDLRTNKVSFSPEWKRQIGFDDDEIGDEYHEWESRVHPQDLPGAKERIAAFIDNPWSKYTNEFRLRHKDGSYRWIMATASLIHGDDGRQARMLGAHIDISGRRREEEALRRSEEMLRKSQRVAEIGSWWFDPETMIPAWSEQIYHIFDLPPDTQPPDYAGHRQYIHADDWPMFDRMFTRALAEGVGYDIEFRIVLPKGSTRYVHAIGKPVLASDGSVIEVMGTLQNITRRKHAELALRQSQKRYRDLFESIHDAILVANTDRTIIDCNEAFIDLFGYAKKKVVGEHTSLLYRDNAYFEEVGETIREHFSDKSFLVTIEYRKASGELFAGETNVFYLKDEAGKVYGYIGLIRDISERLVNERRLRRSEARFRRLVENLFDAVIVISQEGVIHFANHAACALFDRSADDLVGNVFGFPLSLNAPQEIEIVQKAGTVRYAEIKVSPSYWDDDKVFLASIRDITNSVLAKLEREQHQESLQKLQRLEAIGTLAGGIAHDFNNILTPILGFTELARERVRKDEIADDCLTEVYQSATRARELVGQILAFSRQGEETYKPILVEPIVHEVLKLIRSGIPRSIDIHQDIRSRGMIFGDETEIHQILMNLCTNAGHAMEENGGELHIMLQDLKIRDGERRPHQNLGSGRYIHLRVADSGCGMKRSDVDRIFEPYFTTKEKDKGTGLGLSVVHGIVHNHGGVITVDSEKGAGTTFDIYLPRTSSPKETRVEAKTDLPTGDEHILLVDDEPPILKLNTRILESLGYRVTSRSSSVEALQLFKKRFADFDLLLTDMTMPEMTGEQLVQKCLVVYPDLPVVMATGFSERMSEERAREIGIRELLLKPVTKAQMATAIRRAFEKGMKTREGVDGSKNEQ